MNRRLAAFLSAAAAAVAAGTAPASALDPLPPSAVVVGMQEVRQYLTPLGLCQVDVLLKNEEQLLREATGGATESALIGILGLGSDSGVHDLALLTFAQAAHSVDKEHPERRALVQPLEKAATNAAASITQSASTIDTAAKKLPLGSCPTPAPATAPPIDVFSINRDNSTYAAKRKAIEVYITPNMGQRLLRISNALQLYTSATTSASVLAAVKSQFNDLQLSAAQLNLLEYVAIQEALDGQLAIRGRSIAKAENLVRQQQIGAYADALQSLQTTMPASGSIVQNIQG